jgi:outer membrane lipoprotein-sorting protein
MRKFPIKLSLAIAGIVSLNVLAQDDPKAIMQKSLDANTLAGYESIGTLIINDGKGNQRVRKFSTAVKTDAAKNTTKTIMRFLEPADVKGTGILTLEYEKKDNDMWLYLPALRKVRRIVSSEKTKSFMGSEFTNSDITRPKINDYTYKLIGAETVGDVECWKIEMTPASKQIVDEYGYSKRTCWIGKADFVSRKYEFYDLDGRLLKVMMTDKVKLLDEKNRKYQPADITMDNKQNGRSSRFVTDKIVFNPNVKEEYFTTDYLEK